MPSMDTSEYASMIWHIMHILNFWTKIFVSNSGVTAIQNLYAEILYLES